MRQKGVVIQEVEQGVRVRIYRSSACGEQCSKDCTACSCAKTIELTAKNPLGASMGDAVVVESSTKTILSMAAVLYLVPIAVALIVFFVAQAFGVGETGSVLASLGGFVVGFIPAIVLNHKLSRHEIISHSVCEIVEPRGESISDTGSCSDL